jgi:hypothetical protein
MLIRIIGIQRPRDRNPVLRRRHRSGQSPFMSIAQ